MHRNVFKRSGTRRIAENRVRDEDEDRKRGLEGRRRGQKVMKLAGQEGWRWKGVAHARVG